AKTGSDSWAMNADGQGQPSVVRQTPYNEYAGRLSPDGQWIAYTSDESGQPEIYVQRFPSGSDQSKVSSQGGSEPQWRGNGRELFYLGANHTLIGVPISLSPTFRAGRASKVHDT